MLTTKLRTHIGKLHQKKYRKQYNEFITEGFKGVDEALEKNAEVLFVVMEENFSKTDKGAHIIKKAEDRGVEVHLCSENDINKFKNTTTYPGVSAVAKMKTFNLDDLVDDKPIIALDKVNDPGNLGTIIRTADWFGMDNVLLSEDSVDPYNDKSVRSTMGSIFSSKVYQSANIADDIKDLKEKGYEVIMLDMEGDDVDTLKHKDKVIYLFGSESHGVSEELEKFADKRYTIKGSGNAESLNLSIAAGIVLSKIKSNQ